MRASRIIFILLGASALTGCGNSFFVNPKEQPVLVSKIGPENGETKIISLATTAERRNIYVNVDTGQACFEAPPDAAEAITANFSAAIQAAIGSGETVGGSLGDSFATAITSLSKRSQGVILFRDVVFNLCLERLKGKMTDQEYLAKFQDAVDKVIPLIKEEIDVSKGNIGPAVTTTTPAVTTVKPDGSSVVTGGTSTTVNKPAAPAIPVAPGSPGAAGASDATDPTSKAKVTGVAAGNAAESSVLQHGGTATQAEAAKKVATEQTTSAVASGASPSIAGAVASSATSAALSASPATASKAAAGAAAANADATSAVAVQGLAPAVDATTVAKAVNSLLKPQ